MDMPKRRTMRLREYDYSQNGAYFVTICAFQRAQLFGSIDVGQGLCSCRLSDTGSIIDEEIRALERRFASISVDKHVIMPNHIHLILSIGGEARPARQEQSPCPTAGDAICALKSITTKRANAKDGAQGRKIWQFRFHDRIIRNAAEYCNIWNYIDTNPALWERDCFYVREEG